MGDASDRLVAGCDLRPTLGRGGALSHQNPVAQQWLANGGNGPEHPARQARRAGTEPDSTSTWHASHCSGRLLCIKSRPSPHADCAGSSIFESTLASLKTGETSLWTHGGSDALAPGQVADPAQYPDPANPTQQCQLFFCAHPPKPLKLVAVLHDANALSAHSTQIPHLTACFHL